MESKGRLRSLDILKGIAIISVVVGHAGFGGIITKYLSSFHLQLFFFVSGLLFSSEKYKEFTVFTKRRAKSLLLPYATFAIITIIICMMCTLVVGHNLYNLPESLKGIVWSNKSIFPITGGIWFLQCMFVVEIVYWLITRFVSYRLLPVVAIVFAILSFFQSMFVLPLPFSIDSALSAIVFFCVGNLSRSSFSKLNSTSTTSAKMLFLGTGIILIGAIISFVNGSVNPRTCEYGNIVLYYLAALISIVGWGYLAVGMDRKRGELFSWVNYELSEAGRNSIVYLGLNQLVLTGLFYFYKSIFYSESIMYKATRNILVCFFTCLIIKYIARIVLSTKLKVLIGR